MEIPRGEPPRIVQAKLKLWTIRGRPPRNTYYSTKINKKINRNNGYRMAGGHLWSEINYTRPSMPSNHKATSKLRYEARIIINQSTTLLLKFPFFGVKNRIFTPFNLRKLFNKN